MRSYLVCSLGVALLVVAGCGDDRITTDARDGSGDSKSDGNASTDRPDTSGDVSADMSGAAGTGGSTGGTGGSTGGVSGTGGTGGSTGGTGGGTGGGTDAGAPTCDDGIKNSDETGVDCGGHCGKCGPGNPCVVNADCTYSCKADKTCAACNLAADCSGNESECEHRTCTAGVCGSMREAAGTVLTVQATGDCKRRQCAADGTVANANDDTDVPEDRNPCTNDICTTGAPSHTMMPANSNCGGANHCNANGQCVGCGVPADCPGTDTACRTRTCSTAGVCGFNFTAANTKLVDPTAGDCKGLQCDGAGNSQVFNDSADLPVDGNVCTTDECSSGTPSHRPVASATPCGGSGSSLVCDGANNCVECLSASTCPGADTDCHTRSCVTGQCGITNLAAGTLIAAQTPGDCKKSVCNGQGTSGPVSDDLDLPVDGNACTQDVCTAGTASNPFVTAGVSCGGSTICNGQGACVTCLTASSCPGTDTDCHTRTCTNGACGVSFAPVGTPVTLQMSGDCKKVQCDGSGQTMAVADNADVPADGNMCTDDICTTGVPSNPNLTAGTTCGTNQMCNGQGACVGCLTAANCGTNTDCRTFACTNNECVVTNVPAGTLLPATSQTASDCKKVQCDGAGQSQTVNDDTDKPVDTNACTRDVCTGGIPTNPPENAGTACSQGGGSKCNGSGTAPACVQCLATTDCSGTDTECHHRTCTAGVCGISNTADGTAVGLQIPKDCKKDICMTGNQVTVNDPTDLPVDNNGCTMDLCMNGTPSNPSLPQNATCNESGGTRCNGAPTSPACVQCLTNAQCGTDSICQTFTCAAGVCVTNNVPNGTAVAAQSQIPGDCKTAVCNGNGNLTTAVNNLDLPVDTNACTQNLCNAGNPSNPPENAGVACNQSGGIKCDGNGACVTCLVDTDCGTDTFCNTFNCSAAHTCGSTSKANGTLLPGQIGSDCKASVCMSGVETQINDNDDVIVDGNQCTDDLCSNGTPQNPPVPAATPCGTNQMCNVSGMCVGCLQDSDCGTPTDCKTPVCNSGTCGFIPAPVGTVVSTPAPIPGDCKQNVCDGNGNVDVAIDDNDKPSTGNICQPGVCNAGIPGSQPATVGTACTAANPAATQCDGAGLCVECLTAITCPGGTDTTCHTKVCIAGFCDISFATAGTVDAVQSSGDCKEKQCDGAGNSLPIADTDDFPPPTGECKTSFCTGNMADTGNVAHGMSCSEGGGRTCDGAGACITSFRVLRVVGTTGNGSPAFIEERLLDGTVVTGGTTEVTLPTTASGANQALTLSGSSTSEASLSLSGDGRYLIVGGYNAALGASLTTANRVVGRIDAAKPAAINTTTFVPAATAYGGNNNIRGATSQDGSGFWASGSGSGTTGGFWWLPLGSTGPGAVQLTTAQTNTRWIHVFNGQLYATSNQGALANVFTVGTGLPMTATAALNALPGMVAGGANSPFSFVFFDLNSPAGVDTMYMADDGNGGTANPGIQKWTLSSGMWTRGIVIPPIAGTPALTPGFKGLTGVVTGTSVTLIATTQETAVVTRIVKYVDTGSGTPAPVIIGTAAAAGTSYRGVAMSPHL